ncbi:cell division control protein 14, SIN component-domain-containing protein [Fomitopsis serialis]|uniref:cell division control protein 14, SIN component-domain-containing protein n=1 Tax=Fomitopsis serialis TaxID=139415 RepID=UPI0020075E85|nr:cell division control protein 14, SIN component-domain-containing protein [Neoantrodia serialis]KAH9938129.1 cell division control protein 14, SIN component-domain-containing protein [Neoantrodia serialis]
MDDEQAMKDVLQDALDELVSTRSSSARVGEVLSELERFMAELCSHPHTDREAAERLFVFTRLQDTFECNVPSRVLQWMVSAQKRLEEVTSTSKPSSEYHDRKREISTISGQLVQALSIVQGVTLTHKGSKRFLGRQYAMEIMLNLLLTSRHVPWATSLKDSDKASSSSSKANNDDSTPSHNVNPAFMHLTCVALDTLLCILVDASQSLRVFEELNGVQLVVKLLKRSGSPREIRMKCLEFLYFYLLDETGVSTATSPNDISQSEVETPLDSVSTSPTSPTDRYSTPHRSGPSISSIGSRDTSGSSLFSAASSVFTAATSLPSGQNTPKPSAYYPRTPSRPLPPPALPHTCGSQRPQQRNLMMLKKDVDYTPQSPKKAQIAGLGVGTPRSATPMRTQSKLRAAEDLLSSEASETDDNSDPLRFPPTTPRPKVAVSSLKRAESTPLAASSSEAPKTPVPLSKHRRARSELDVLSTPAAAGTPTQGRATSSGAVLQRATHRRATHAKTTEEKKELLGTLLGNVDALVAGVRQQGIWGLG